MSGTEGVKSIPKRLYFQKDILRLKRMCKSKLAALKKEYGADGLTERLRVSDSTLNAWLMISGNGYDMYTIPEFRYLLAIDSLFIFKEELV